MYLYVCEWKFRETEIETEQNVLARRGDEREEKVIDRDRERDGKTKKRKGKVG